MSEISRSAGASAKPAHSVRLALFGVVGAVLAASMALSAFGPNPRIAAAREWPKLVKATPADLPRIKAIAIKSLKSNPLDADAVGLVGTTEEMAGDKSGSEKLMRAAGALSRRVDAADLLLFQRDVQTQHLETAFNHVDAYMRRRPNTVPPELVKLVVVATAQPGGAAIAGKHLALNPPWREGYFGQVAAMSKDPAFAFSILQGIQAAGGTVDFNTLNSHLKRMVDAQRYEEAYLQWLLFLSDKEQKSVGYLNDGDFNSTVSATPFGWSIPDPKTASLEKASAYGRAESALRLGYDGFSAAAMPFQYTLLPPGPYRLQGVALAETPESLGRIKVMFGCADAPSPLIEYLIAGTPEKWASFSLDFTVPAEGCVAQKVSFVPVPGFKHVGVGAWVDHLTLTAVSGGQP